MNIQVELSSSSPQYSGNSFIIATSVSVAILIILLVVVILCARRKRQLQKRRLQQQLQRSRQELQVNNPSSNIDQQILQNLLNQNPMALLAQQVLMNLPQAVEKDDKKYFQDFDKCFPLMTLQQIRDYLKQENPNLKLEDISKECSICYCDFEEEEEQKEQDKNEQQQKSEGSSDKSQNKKEPNKSLRILTYCNHFFHDQCIKDWLKKDKTCPHCRQKLTQQELNQIKNLLENKVIERTKRLIQNLQNQQKSEVVPLQNSIEQPQSNKQDKSDSSLQENDENKKDNKQNSQESQEQLARKKSDQNGDQINKVDQELNEQKDDQMNRNAPLKKYSNLNIVSKKSLSRQKKINFSQLDSPTKKNSLSPLQKLKQRNSQKEEEQIESINLQNFQANNLSRKESQSPRKKNNSLLLISPMIQSINNSNTSIVSERLQESQMEQSIIIEEDVSKCQIQTQEDENSKDLNQEDYRNINILEQIKEEEEEEKHQQELKGQFEIPFSLREDPPLQNQPQIQTVLEQKKYIQQNIQADITFSEITKEIQSQINQKLDSLMPKKDAKFSDKKKNKTQQKQSQQTLIEMKDFSKSREKNNQ